MTEVLLINPRVGNSDSTDPVYSADMMAMREPLGVLAVATYLESHGYQVEIIDAALYPDELIREKVRQIVVSKPLAIGFSVMTAQVSSAYDLSKFVRSLDVTIPIIWGGIHPTLFPVQTSLDAHIDFVVYGPGESTCLELVNKLAAGKTEFENVKGIACRGVLMPPREAEDVNALPFLDYDLLDLKWYLGPSPHFLLSDEPIKALNVLSSRGCPWRCSFCVNYVTKNRWRALTPERFLDELEHQVFKYGLEAVRILDEDFFVSRKRVTAIVDGLNKRGLRLVWGTNGRADYFDEKYISVEYAKMMAGAGMKFVSIGAESGSDRVLKLLNKEISVHQIITSAEVCAKAGIVPVYSWMVGIPSQTKAEMRANIALMKQINRICPWAIHVGNWIFRPFPGGELYEMCKEYGLNEPCSLEEWKALAPQREMNTGLYAVSALPWIDDPDFVQFIGDYSLTLAPTPRNRGSIVQRVWALVASLAFVTWDWPLLGPVIRKAFSLLRSFGRVLMGRTR